MIPRREIQTTLPQKTSVGRVVHAKGKFRKTLRSRTHATCEDPRAGTAGSGSVILDIEFVVFRGKNFARSGVVGLDGDKGGFFVLKAEAGCHDRFR
jgi:hypothetical protein